MATIAKKATAVFSIDAIRNLESEGFARIRECGDRVIQIAIALESVSVAMQTNLAIRSIDSQTSLTAAGQRLAAILDGEGSA